MAEENKNEETEEVTDAATAAEETPTETPAPEVAAEEAAPEASDEAAPAAEGEDAPVEGEVAEGEGAPAKIQVSVSVAGQVLATDTLSFGKESRGFGEELVSPSYSAFLSKTKKGSR